MLGLYRDNGKEDGNYYLGLGFRVYSLPEVDRIWAIDRDLILV